MLHYTYNPLHDIIHIGKIPLAVAIVEYLDGLPLTQLVGEPEICHIRASGRSIDSEKAKAG